ncbi:MAG: peptidoglycan DD-metalloendopeptidase family protein [Gammaproteobacteria bacterium]|nr:peptidoglycan DD-metalloendopeptidase family protein [Gammaproteobacteria bacterium]
MARYLRLLTLALVVLLIVQLLTACGSSNRAKVVSLEQSGQKAGKLPSTYRVRRGDTLYAIAWRYGLDHRSLARINGIKPPYTIYPGQSVWLKSHTVPKSRSVVKKKNIKSGKSTPKVTKKSTKTSQSKKTTKPAKSSSAKQKSGKSSKSSKSSSSSGKSKKVGGGGSFKWGWPTRGKVIKRFSANDPARQGIEIGGGRGQRIIASEKGRVVYAGSGLIGYGRLVIIKHNKNYLSAYGRNRKLLVNEGTEVKKGQALAEMGKSGNGYALHFEIRKNGEPVDPLKLLPR